MIRFIQTNKLLGNFSLLDMGYDLGLNLGEANCLLLPKGFRIPNTSTELAKLAFLSPHLPREFSPVIRTPLRESPKARTPSQTHLRETMVDRNPKGGAETPQVQQKNRQHLTISSPVWDQTSLQQILPNGDLGNQPDPSRNFFEVNDMNQG